MANAFVTRVLETAPAEDQTTLNVTVEVVYSGSDVGRADVSSFAVAVTANDTANTIRTKISNACVSEAQKIGYAVSTGSIVQLAFQKA